MPTHKRTPYQYPHGSPVYPTPKEYIMNGEYND